MAGPCNNAVKIFSVDNKNIHNKNELISSYPPKRFHQEYIAPVRRGKDRRATFQAAMKLTVLIGQCFGLNPVLGVCDLDTSKLRFTFCSGRCFYGVLSIVGQCTMFFFYTLTLFKDTDWNLPSNASIVFYGTNGLSTILFFRLAMKWPKLCQQVSRTEAVDPNLDTGLIRRCNISCILVLSFAVVEHVLSDLSGIALAIEYQSDKNLFEAFFLQNFPWVWTYVPYNNLLASSVYFLNLQCTFNWNFADAFVICISWYLTSRLEQLNQRILALKGKFAPSSFWRRMREDYSRHTNLIRRVDAAVGSIIFLSFANNLFFICLQLLHTIEPLKGYEQALYFVYSLAFLIMRSLAVSLTAARVHTASRVPAQVLYDVPSTAYCIEVQRFLNQVHGDTIALSGLQFFNVKRGLILTIAGAIVTYELVLMQMAGVTPTATPPPAQIIATSKDLNESMT